LGWKYGDTAMSELITTTELTDAELDAVSGGFLDFGNAVWQENNATNMNLNVLGLGGENEQNISQSNTSLIGSAIFTSPVMKR
jgi:hypothetical protein